MQKYTKMCRWIGSSTSLWLVCGMCRFQDATGIIRTPQKEQPTHYQLKLYVFELWLLTLFPPALLFHLMCCHRWVGFTNNFCVLSLKSLVDMLLLFVLCVVCCVLCFATTNWSLFCLHKLWDLKSPTYYQSSRAQYPLWERANMEVSILRGHWICNKKAYQWTESWSRVLYLPQRRASTQHWAALRHFIWLTGLRLASSRPFAYKWRVTSAGFSHLSCDTCTLLDCSSLWAS